MLGNEDFRRWYATRLRLSASPAAAVALQRMNIETDTRPVLPSVRVPTLVLHRVGDRNVDVKNARYAAEHIPGAGYVELPGDDHLPWVGDSDAIVEQDTAGDGVFASFDGPGRAIRCASAIVEAVGRLGLELRVGLHTGECEVVDGKVAGSAVHIGSRVAANAAPGEVLVSRTLRDLVAGPGSSSRTAASAN